MDTLRKMPVASVATLTENWIVRMEHIAAASVDVQADNTAGAKVQNRDWNARKHCNPVLC